MSLEDVRRHIDRRSDSDYHMSVWLPYLPFILIMIGIMMLFLASLTVAVIPLAILLYFIGAVIDIYVLYKWIKRRNEHFKRQILLENSIVNFMGEKRSTIGDEVNTLSEIVKEGEVKESKKSIGLWVILSLIIPIFLLYVYHFLTRDFYKHEAREDMFLSTLNKCFEKLEVPALTYRREKKIPSRNTILYAVLIIVTVGLFGLYWIYTITKDPNNHFMEQVRWEDETLKILEGLSGEKVS